MNSVRLVSENGVSNIQKKLWYVDNSSEINLDNFEVGDRIYSINDNKLFQIEYDTSSEQEYSGEIVSFEADEDDRISSLEVEINPVQDLHGYANPWPAGGGKNKLPPPTQNSQTTSGVTFVKNNDGSITLSGTATANAAIVFVSFDLPAGDYILSNVGSNAAGSGGEATVYVRDITNSATLTSFELGDSVSGFLFTLSANINIRFYAVVQSGVTVSGTLYPMIRNSGDGDNTYAPYSNECPISGYTGLMVMRTGKNLFDKSNANILNAYYATGQNQVIHAGSSFRCVWLPCKPNTTYTIINPAKGKASIAYTTVEPADNVPVYNAATNTTTTGSDAKYIVMYVWNSTSDTATFDDVLNSLQIELGSTASTYEPYTGTTIPITFPTTIYGGSDEVIGGALESTMAIIDMGDMSWTYDATNDFFASSTLLKLRKTGIDFICSCYRNGGVVSDSQMSSAQDKSIYSNSVTGGWISVKDTTYTNANDFKTAVTGQKICYAFATPVEYTLSANELNTLYGTNNIWTDAGEINVKIIKNDMTAFELGPHI